ncbi:MAG: hypothetical protein KAX19_07680 [Candidatus Brocadiae bacterium]|nr:hypothetical protein [Candidatus Brocadiia bacterium]
MARYRLTVLAGCATESLELYEVPEEAVPAIGTPVQIPAAVRRFVDRQGVPRYALHMAPVDSHF